MVIISQKTKRGDKMIVTKDIEKRIKPVALSLLQQCIEQGFTVEDVQKVLDYTKGELTNNYLQLSVNVLMNSSLKEENE